MDLGTLEVPIEILSIEVLGFAIRVEARVGDKVQTFDHVATIKELEEMREETDEGSK